MSELQIGLIGLGVTAIVGVAAYNAWQEYRQRKLAERVLQADHTDVLLDAVADEASPAGSDQVTREAVAVDVPAGSFAGERSEPRLGERLEPVLRFEPEAETETAVDVAATVVDADERRAEPQAEPKAEPEPEPQPLPAPAPHEPLLAQRAAAEAPVDAPVERAERGEKNEKAEKREKAQVEALLAPLIDYVGVLEAAAPVAGAQIAGLQQSALSRVGKALHWIGYNEASHEWETIAGVNASSYRQLRIGLQLVDRRGPVAASEIAAFQSGLRALAGQLAASVELPPAQEALDSAVQLDEFCAGVDIQIGLNVVAGSLVFPGTKLRALAEAAGMVIAADGRFVRCDDDGNVLYVLINQEAAGFAVDTMKSLSTHGVTFLLDVPSVAHCDRVFNQMVELARRFADVLRGNLVDDNRRPLSDGALEPIRRQIAQYQAQMQAAKIAPGGVLAQRLFS